MRNLIRFVLVLQILVNSVLAVAQRVDSASRETKNTTVVSVAKTLPRTVRFSGVVKPAGLLHGSSVANVTFALYADAQGGSPSWEETQNVTLDEQGRFTVLLGATSNEGLPLSLFVSGEARWLAVRLADEGAVEQSRVQLVSVPYALAAGDAQSLGGRPVSDFQLKKSIGGDAMANFKDAGTGDSANPNPLARFNLGTVTSITAGDGLTGGTITSVGTIGVDPTVARKAIDNYFTTHQTVTGNLTATGMDDGSLVNGNVKGLLGSFIGVGGGLKGEDTDSGPLGNGVIGISHATGARSAGVWGISSDLTSGASGVHGQAKGSAGNGVRGDSFPGTNNTADTGGIGVLGTHGLNNERALGVNGSAVGGIGVLGRNHSASGTAIGVRGETLATGGTGYGIYGFTASANGVGGVFENGASGKILSGRANGEEKFSVDGSGNVFASGTVTSTQFGLVGTSTQPGGIGISGFSTALNGAVGVQGTVTSANGIAGVFDNLSGGRILSARNNGVDTFHVEENGFVFSNTGFGWGNPSSYSTINNDQNGSIELGGNQLAASPIGVRPFIDFHFGVGQAEDYNFRVMNSQDHRLDFVAKSGDVILSLDGTGVTPGAIGAALKGGNLGIGIVAPNSKLHVVANTVTSSSASIKAVQNGAAPSSGGIFPSAISAQATSATGFVNAISGVASSPNSTAIFALNTANSGAAQGIVAVSASPAGTAGIFENPNAGKLISGRVSSVEKFGVDGGGNVTASGRVSAASVTTNGDLSITNTLAGVILKAPSGGCFRISVSDAGALTTSPVACP